MSVGAPGHYRILLPIVTCERTHCHMVTLSQASSKRSSRYLWTEAREQVFIDCLLDAVKQGKRTDTGWKPIVASEAVYTFRSKGFPAVTKRQLDSNRDAVYDPRSIGPDLH